MNEIGDFGAIVLAVSATVFVALLGMRLADRFSIPYAALFLVGSALIAEIWTDLQTVLSVEEVERIAVVALILILFDGGLHIGIGRFRRSAGPILALGVLGTFLTAGFVALAAHYVLGFSWIACGARRRRDRADRSGRHVLRLRLDARYAGGPGRSSRVRQG